MGKQIRLWAEKEREKEEKFTQQFTQHNAKEAAKKRIKPANDNYLTALMTTHRNRWLRQFADWEPRTKSHKPLKKQLELLRFLFQKYPVPSFVEDIWFVANRGGTNPLEKYIPWYFAIAQGESLFKNHAKGTLTKKECFYFVKAPSEFTFVQNLWWAKAMALGAKVGAANNIARSKLHQMPGLLNDEFWYTFVMFFVRSPAPPNKINDIYDYVSFRRQDNPQYSLTGRTLATFEKQLEEWHRFLAKQKIYGQDHWKGSDLPDWQLIAGSDDHRIIWSVHQIKNGKELVAEGAAMRHCVSSYRGACVSGRSSIWSMTRYDARFLETRKCITIELNREGMVVQARGFANRIPKGDEYNILNKWVSEHGLSTSRYY